MKSATRRLIAKLLSCLYILQILSAFITVLGGGNSSPPGGRIGTAMLLTWLIPAILLSNSVGGFASRRSCFRIISKMVKNIRSEQGRQRMLLILGQLQNEVQDDQEQHQRQLREPVESLLEIAEARSAPEGATVLDEIINEEETFFHNQRWSGGSDVYRPEKSLQFDTRSEKKTWSMLALSIGPVFVSCVFGSAIIALTTPYGFNCRSVMVLVITGAWLFSVSFTHATWKWGPRDRRKHWKLIFWKDVFVAVPSVVLIFLSSAGVFNTCDCWSFKISKGKDAHVPLNSNPEFERLDGKIYPILVALCLSSQFALFSAMYFVGRPGFKLMRWSETEKQREFLEM